jgi:hypothetical protein
VLSVDRGLPSKRTWKPPAAREPVWILKGPKFRTCGPKMLAFPPKHDPDACEKE